MKSSYHVARKLLHYDNARTFGGFSDNYWLLHIPPKVPMLLLQNQTFQSFYVNYGYWMENDYHALFDYAATRGTWEISGFEGELQEKCKVQQQIRFVELHKIFRGTRVSPDVEVKLS